MEKERLVKFIATVMEENGFNTTINYPVDNQIIDIYGTLDTSIGEIGVVVACKNYEDPWRVGLDILKDMESAAKTLKASKVMIFTTSTFTRGATVYAQKRNIKLVDKKGLMKIAQNFSKKQRVISEPVVDEDDFDYDDYYYESSSSRPASLNPNRGNNSHAVLSRRLSRNRNNNSTSNNYQIRTDSSRNYLNRSMTSVTDVKSRLPAINIDIDNLLEFFKNNIIVYLIILVIIASLISFILNKVTSGPYTGIGKIVTSMIVCYGGLLLVERNVSDLLFKGSLILFISIMISILTLNL